MANITCLECNAAVSDTLGYCPECGYPFDSATTNQNIDCAVDEEAARQQTITASPVDTIQETLDSIRQEMNELQRTVTMIKEDFDSHSLQSTAATQKILAEIIIKLDTIASAKNAKGAEAQAEPPKKTKKELLTAFYRTLNSPNSMFEYMFYICVVQIIFVVISLFLVTYIVTLVR